LVEELHQTPFFIIVRWTFHQQILESCPTFREFLLIILSKGTDFLSCLIYSGHWEKLVVKLLQQFFPGRNRARCHGIQPFSGSVMEGERKKSKIDRFLGEILEFGGGSYTSKLLNMGIRVFMF
jgi:hypothetical protein